MAGGGKWKGRTGRSRVSVGKKGRRRHLVFDSDSEEGDGGGEVSEGESEGESEGGSEGESEVEEEIGLEEMEGGEMGWGVGEEGERKEGERKEGSAEGEGGVEIGGEGEELTGEEGGKGVGLKTGLKAKGARNTKRHGSLPFTDEDDAMIKSLYSDATRVPVGNGSGSNSSSRRSTGRRGKGAVAKEVAKAMGGKFSVARLAQRIHFLGLPEDGMGRKKSERRRHGSASGFDEILKDMEDGEKRAGGEEEEEETKVEEGETEDEAGAGGEEERVGDEEGEEGEEEEGEDEKEEAESSEDEDNVLLSPSGSFT
ncbi:unnamed protein product [Closterium sp. NIES-53]